MDYNRILEAFIIAEDDPKRRELQIRLLVFLLHLELTNKARRQNGEWRQYCIESAGTILTMMEAGGEDPDTLATLENVFSQVLAPAAPTQNTSN